VKQIADEAANKIAAESPIDEDVVITVEELPPAEATSDARDGIESLRTSATAGLPFVADGVGAWFEMTKSFLAPGSGVSPMSWLDPRPAIELSFQLAEDLLAIQKESFLRLAAASPFAK
jgi:hypothetical protein